MALEPLRGGALIQTAADGAVQKIAGGRIGVSRAADSAENTIAGDGIGVALTDHFIAYPKDQNAGKKKR